eukprot:537674-Pleurochrysis_carterae.AAC.2
MASFVVRAPPPPSSRPLGSLLRKMPRRVVKAYGKQAARTPCAGLPCDSQKLHPSARSSLGVIRGDLHVLRGGICLILGLWDIFPIWITWVNGRGNYGCASNECNVWERKLVHTTRPVAPRAHDYTVREDRGREPSGSRSRHALRGVKSRTRRNGAKTHKCHQYAAKTCKCE